MLIGASISTMPPFWFLARSGFWCLRTMRMPSTRAVILIGSTSMTRPVSPRFAPVMTSTRSPLRIFGFGVRSPARRRLSLALTAFGMTLDNLRSERHDLHELALAQLARNRAEDARPDRLAVRLDEHGGVLVEANVG